jgi:hypothetical protein
VDWGYAEMSTRADRDAAAGAPLAGLRVLDLSSIRTIISRWMPVTLCTSVTVASRKALYDPVGGTQKLGTTGHNPSEAGISINVIRLRKSPKGEAMMQRWVTVHAE